MTKAEKLEKEIADLPMCEEGGKHYGVVVDAFARDFGGRHTPGDCYCLKCHEPVEAWWNGGNPIPA